MTDPDVQVTGGGAMTDEELAAVMAAAHLVLTRPSGGGWPTVDEVPRWRFSGRWWSKPIPIRRDRPF